MAAAFRLKRIRQLTEREVEQETAVLSEYERALKRLRENLESLGSDLDDRREHIARESRDGMSVRELQMHVAWIRSLMLARGELAERCQTASVRIDEQRRALLDLHREEQMLQRLEERHGERLKRSELRRLEKELDDTRASRYRNSDGSDF